PSQHGAEPKPDDEQQHDHAELAEMEELANVIQRIEGAEHIGPDDHACGEIAEHSAHAERTANRRSNGRRGKKYRHLNELRRDHGLARVSLASVARGLALPKAKLGPNFARSGPERGRPVRHIRPSAAP